MKKLIFGICAAAAIFMVGCSKDASTDEVPASNAINFSTYLGRDVQKRSSILDNTSLTNFGVFASYTKDEPWDESEDGFNFMFDQKVTKTSGSWDYTPKKYWPTKKGEKISFWAYAPYASENAISVNSTKNSIGLPVIKYTISDITKAEDFVAATLMNQVRTAPATDPDASTCTVKFALKHELTRVNIQAKLDETVDDKTKVNITSIEFNGGGVAKEALYMFPSTSGDRGAWVPFPHNPDGDTIVVDPLMKKNAVDLGGYITPGVRLAGDIEEPVFNTNEFLFLIPPGGVSGITTEYNKIKIRVTYDIVTVDSALAAGHSVSTAVKEIELPTGSLKQGTAYLYTLTFYMNEIVLSAEVDENGWKEENEEGVEDDVDWNDVDK